jgi:cytochrome P450
MATLAPAREIVLISYDDVRAALQSIDLARSIDPERFEKGNIEEQTLPVLHGDEHRDRRRVENALFRRQALELYERVLFPDIVEHTLATFVPPDRSDLMEIGGLLTVVLACRTAGVDLDRASLEQRQRLREFLHLFALGGAIDVALGDVEEIKALMRATLADFDREFVRASWERRQALVERCERGELPASELPADVLTTLLRSRIRGDLEMDDALLLRETVTFFSAGAHTSTQTLTNTFYLLFSWCQEHPEDWDRLTEDRSFAQRAVQEALRCRPTNPMIHRRALRDTVVGRHEIEAGTIVKLDTVAASTDPDAYGADAGGYDPHRRVPDGMPPYGMSFGAGMHQCIGRTLAVGLPVRGDQAAPGADHLYGLVPLAVQALVRRGLRPDPERKPVPDTKTRRYTRWASYPVRFEAHGTA